MTAEGSIKGRRPENDKVLITAPPLTGPGGVEAYIAALLPHLSSLTSGGVDHLSIGGQNRGRHLPILGDATRLRRKLNSREFGVLHLNPSLNLRAFIRDAALLRIGKANGLRVITSFHGWNEAFASAITRTRGAIFRLLYGGADVFTVLAAKHRAQILSWQPNSVVHTERTVVDDRLLEHPVTLATRGSAVRVLFLARVEREKGIFDLIDAVAKARACGVDLTLSIAGDGSALGAARKMVESIGCGSAVRFLGYLRGEEKASALANHDLYCLPTYHPEGIPVALLEAMAFGLPIAVADSGGIADIFDETKMGALVRPQEPDALADSLIRLANDRNRMEQIASFNREFARENFLASRVATRIASYYSTLHEGI